MRRLVRVARRHREAVVLARHEYAAGAPVEHRVVRAAVTERELERLVAGREPEQLMAEADAEHRHPPEQPLDLARFVMSGSGSPGPFERSTPS